MSPVKKPIVLAIVLVLVLAASGIAFAVVNAAERDAAPDVAAAGEEKEEAGAAIFPDFTVQTVDGELVSLSDMKGKPVVIGYWATWCPYCVDEAPAIQALYETYGENVNFMMIDLVDGEQETVESGSAWIEEQGYTYPVYYDLTGDAAYAGSVYYLPTTFILDAEGKVVVYSESAVSFAEVSDVLASLLTK
ncbi:TlpA family protein disulfide reductase [Slackia heliotrinireducens]|uniref:TlpA family protein disulfide reductase n=1 Tax=Slackia heliotrinireducens TaxID=84110 RepID=UPI003315ACE6